MKLLFVCLGNICRSPSAEAVMRAYAPDWEIDSAGTGAWHIGNPPDARAQAEGKRRGYDLSPLRARQVRISDFDEFDAIYAMDRANYDDLAAMMPKTAHAKLALFLGDADVPDPYYDGSFARMFDLIEVRAREIAVAGIA